MPKKPTKDSHPLDFLHNHAVALGHLCIYWAWLEDVIDELLETLLPLEEGDISRTVTANIDLRDKIQIIKGLAFIRKPSKEWFKRIAEALDYIDNELRSNRNRFIHDSWHGSSREIIRRKKRVSFKKPEAFKLEMTTLEEVEVLPSEAEELANDVLSAIIEVAGLMVVYIDGGEVDEIPSTTKYLR